MAKVQCHKCASMNLGYIRIYDEHKQWRYYYSDCRCPIPTVRDHAIKIGLHPEYPRKEKQHGQSGLE